MQAIMSIVDRESEWSPAESESKTIKRHPKQIKIEKEIDSVSKTKIENYITETQQRQKKQKKEIRKLKEELEEEREFIHRKIETLEELYKGRIEELESDLAEKKNLDIKKDEKIFEMTKKVKKLEERNNLLEKSTQSKKKKKKGAKKDEESRSRDRSTRDKYYSQKIKNLERLLKEKNEKIEKLYEKIDDLKIDNTALKEVLEEHVKHSQSSHN